MQRNPWSLSTKDTEQSHGEGKPKKPTLKINFDGHSTECLEYLRENSVGAMWPDAPEITVRLQTDELDANAKSILGFANATGDYLLECETTADQVFKFVESVHQYADETDKVVQYYLWIVADDGLVMDWELNELVVFTATGKVLRHRSLLPSGIDA